MHLIDLTFEPFVQMKLLILTVSGCGEVGWVVASDPQFESRRKFAINFIKNFNQ